MLALEESSVLVLGEPLREALGAVSAILSVNVMPDLVQQYVLEVVLTQA